MNRNKKQMCPNSVLKEIVKVTGGFSCTTFCLKNHGHIIYGRNFDFMIGDGHVLINKRNVTKKALVQPSEKQLQWTSTYGSLTFNQIGREFPFGGMNEAGLVIEQLWLDQTQYPKPDERYALSVLQWIQYQLDNAQSVDDIITSDDKIRILDTSGADLHFFITDRKGESASIEFIDGVMVYHKGNTLPYPVLTNNLYSESVAYTENPDILPNDNASNGFTGSSLHRFRTATQMLGQVPERDEEENVNYGFKILEQVNQKDYTQWSILYDISNMAVHFKTCNRPMVKSVKLADYDFSSSSPCLSLNLNENETTANDFIEYNSKANKNLIDTVFNSLDMLNHVPEDIRAITANYPETTVFNDNKYDN